MTASSDGRATVRLDRPLTHYQIARLRIAAFAALKGWGEKRDDGKWKAWDYDELRREADGLASRAINIHSLIERSTESTVPVGSEADLYVGISRSEWHARQNGAPR